MTAIFLRRSLGAGLILCAALLGAAAPAADPPAENDAAQVLHSFEQVTNAPAPADSTDLTRRWVMFALGAPLLVLILITGALGIAMGVYGKPVYVAHMIFAGLSITLAIVHAIVGVVWFRPF